MPSDQVHSLAGLVREICSIRDGYHVTNVLENDEMRVLTRYHLLSVYCMYTFHIVYLICLHIILYVFLALLLEHLSCYMHPLSFCTL